MTRTTAPDLALANPPAMVIEDPLTTFFRAEMPFTEQLGLELVSASPERVVVRGAWAPERCTAAGVLQGGYLMAAADAAGAACAALNVPPGTTTTTIDSRASFLRAVRSGPVTVTSTPLHVGATTVVVQTDLVRDDGRLVGRASHTQVVLPSARSH